MKTNHESSVVAGPFWLNRLCFLFKCFSISSLVVGIFFFLTHYVDTRSYHVSPKEVTFEDLIIKAKWPAKGEARVLLVKNGITVFSSSCDGMTKSLCKPGSLFKEVQARKIWAIELKKGKGIIKDVELRNPDGTFVLIENKEANRYVNEYPMSGYYPAYMSLASFLGFGIAFYILSFSKTSLFKD